MSASQPATTQVPTHSELVDEPAEVAQLDQRHAHHRPGRGDGQAQVPGLEPGPAHRRRSPVVEGCPGPVRPLEEGIFDDLPGGHLVGSRAADTKRKSFR